MHQIMNWAVLYRQVRKIDDRTVVEVCRDIEGIFSAYQPVSQYFLLPGLQTNPVSGKLSDLSGRYAIDEAHLRVQVDPSTTLTLVFSRSVTGPGKGEVVSAEYDQFRVVLTAPNRTWNRGGVVPIPRAWRDLFFPMIFGQSSSRSCRWSVPSPRVADLVCQTGRR